MEETRKFSVHPQIIYNLIVAQAGTLGKAVLECVMNSIDAGASRVDITIDEKRVRIVDDGQGFRSRKEIENWFEVFGFPHEGGNHRIYGQFGIGRGQLWSFCSTVWRTGTFRMDVDIKRRGLDYQLVENLEPVKGVTIEGRFYTPLTTLELSTFRSELAELVRFAQVPVTLNGKQISTDPTRQKWDHDTPDAWVKVTETGSLAVYNLGVLVRRYPASYFGCGGIVVTKPGVRLALNMARNDILTAECEVWKRIRKFLQKCSDTRVRTKRTRLTDAECENLARRFMAGELGYRDIASTKLVTDIVGRGWTIEGFLTGFRSPDAILTKAEIGSRIGERAHRARLAFVLSPITLERFGVETVEEFKRKLLEVLKIDPDGSELQWWLNRLKTFEELQKAVPALREGYDVLKDADLKPHEVAACRALERMAERISRHLRESNLISDATADRRVYIGVSDVAGARTDGRSKIVIERRQLELMKHGIGGFVGLANLLVHEFLHDAEDLGSHTHDQVFYERYHEATCGRAGVLNQTAHEGLRAWVLALHARNLRVPKLVSVQLDTIERAEREGAEAEEGRATGSVAS